MSGVEVLASATRSTPWEGRLWLVGGYVRDALLGLPLPEDVDIVLETDALELANYLYEHRISRIAPVTYPRFGTALVIIGESKVELATARRESYPRESRKPLVEPATLREDALRRDFTINAILKNLHTEEVCDILGMGLQDLDQRLLRTPQEPAKTFSEDPLRMLRAVRFRHRFGLKPVSGLWGAIRSEAQRLSIISMERIRDEFTKMLCQESAAAAMQDLLDLGLLELFAPELAAMQGVEQGGYHEKDVWEHSMEVLDNAARLDIGDEQERLRITLAALLHDVGKPGTKTIDESGRARFFGHERVGAEIADTVLRRLRFPLSVSRDVVALVRNHMRLGSMPVFTPAAARRLKRDMADATDTLLTLCECDARAVGRIEKGIDFESIRALLAQVEVETQDRGFESPLTGEEIMEVAQIESGPEVGRLKSLLVEAVLDGRIPAGDKAAAKSLLLDVMHKKPPNG